MQISDMIAGVDIIGGKVSVASVIGAGGYGDVLTQQQGVLGGVEHTKENFKTLKNTLIGLKCIWMRPK